MTGRGHDFRSRRNIILQTSLREKETFKLPTRFMTDPHQMRAMAGRFDVHAQNVEDAFKALTDAGVGDAIAADGFPELRLLPRWRLSSRGQTGPSSRRATRRSTAR
jgi:hypothetical protein